MTSQPKKSEENAKVMPRGIRSDGTLDWYETTPEWLNRQTMLARLAVPEIFMRPGDKSKN